MKLILIILCISLSGCLATAHGLVAKPNGYYGSDDFYNNRDAKYSYPGWSKYSNYDVMSPPHHIQQYDHYGFN